MRDTGHDQPVNISDLQADAWAKHPDTRLLYIADASGIHCYYNGRVHALPAGGEILDRVRALCARREWSREFIASMVEIEPLARLLLDLAEHGAILPIQE